MTKYRDSTNAEGENVSEGGDGDGHARVLQRVPDHLMQVPT